MKYSFSLGRINVLEQALLSADDIERLLEAKKLAEKIQIFEETIFGDYINQIKGEKDIEDDLDEYLLDFYRLVDELGDENIRQYFRLPFDINNIRPFYKKRLDLAKKSSITFLLLITRTEVDLANIRIWLRHPTHLSEKLIEGGRLNKSIYLTKDAPKIIARTYQPLEKILEEESLVSEKDLDNCIMNLLIERRYEPLSADKLIAFLKAKELEVKNVRHILFGGLNNLDRRDIENNLRQVYA